MTDQIIKVNHFIYLGSCLHPLENSEEFQSLNIDVVFNLTTNITYTNKVGFIVKTYHIDIADSISFVESMDEIADTIQFYLQKKKKIYLHSNHGLSRAPSILIYYYMKYQKLSYETTFQLLKKIHPKMEIDPELENALLCINDD